MRWGWFALAAVLCAGTAIAGDAAPSMDRKDWAADLDTLYSAMKATHPVLHHKTDAATMDAYVARLHREIPHDSWPRYVMGLYGLLALVGDGHTTFFPFPDQGPGFDTRYPVLPAVFRDGVFITAAAPQYRDTVGAKIVAIGGHPISEVFRTAAQYWDHENEMWVVRWLPAVLRRPGYLAGMGLVADDVSKSVAFELERDGKRSTIEVAPVAAAEDSAGMETTWVKARDEKTIPNLTQADGPDGDRPNDFVYLENRKTLYAVYNCVCDSKTETVAAFAERLFKAVDEDQPEKLVIDLRANGGGDNTLNQSVLLGMIKARKIDQPGHLFVLTGPRTFSAAQNFANQAERWTQALFVGEPTGSSPNLWGDAKQMTLPHTALHPMVSTLYWEDSSPNDTRVWILPDIPASPTYADWQAGRDPALDAVFAYRADNAKTEPPGNRWNRDSQKKGWQLPF